MPWRRFAAADAIGAVLWSGFAAVIGYVGGEAFKDSLWKPLALAIGFAVLVGFLGETWRRRTAS